jgi:hypothetical protein
VMRHGGAICARGWRREVSAVELAYNYRWQVVTFAVFSPLLTVSIVARFEMLMKMLVSRVGVNQLMMMLMF